MTEGKKRYCSNCGAEIDPKARICPKCGVEQAPPIEKVSDAWYLAPLFLGLIGGIIAWLVNKDLNAKKARNFLIFGLVWSVALFFLIWIVFVSVFSASFAPITSPSQKNRSVLVKVEYAGEWQGAYGDASGIVSWDGNGTKTIALDRPNDAYLWIVSANAQKSDDSSAVLTIKIMQTDGTILKQASTQSPYGMAQVSDTID
jgi:hypothetical protein